MKNTWILFFLYHFKATANPIPPHRTITAAAPYLVVGALYNLSQLPSDTVMTIQVDAYAPNAGGQFAPVARLAHKNYEYSIFGNSFLLAGSYPLVGALISKRFPIGDTRWPFHPFFQSGVGLSTGGAVLETTWGFQLAWSLRVDMTTHFYVTPERITVWHYPFWVGFSWVLS
ncbi:MAG: hypothetical protein AB8C84_08115 [Oligoflexales bacterium]